MSKYTTKSGDTWDLIAYEQMGSCSYVANLMDANRAYVNTVIFSAGVRLDCAGDFGMRDDIRLAAVEAMR